MNLRKLFTASPYILSILSITTCLISVAYAADVVTITVSKGENIREIASSYLNNPDLWPDILKANELASPHEVQENTVLKIPVKQILAADKILTDSNKMIQEATREGARVFDPELIASAIEMRNRGLNARKSGEWTQAASLASEAGKAAQAALEHALTFRDLPVQAILEQAKGNVHRRKPADTYWHDLLIHAQLSEQEKVRTLSDSYAEIRFRDDSRLRLNQNAQIVIQKMREDRLKKTKKANVSLVGGDIYALLKGSRKTNPFDVEMTGITTAIRSNDFWVDRSDTAARFANYDGEIEVTSAGKSVLLKENQGTLVKKNQKPEQPRELLSAPKNVSPADFTTIYKKGADLKWTADEKAAAYWLEIAKDETFGEIVVSEKNIHQNIYFFPLPEDGVYFWRVASLDADGLPGRKSRASFFKVQYDIQPPFLKITAPDAGAIIVEPVVAIRGSTEQDAVLVFGGQPIPVEKGGGFTAESHLIPGENLLKIEARDPAGNVALVKHPVVHMPDDAIDIAYDADLPRIDGKHFITSQTAFTIKGRTRPAAAIAIHPEEAPSALLKTYSDESGRFYLNLPLSREMETFAVTVTLPNGFSQKDRFTVQKDVTPPFIKVDTILPAQTAENSLALQGTVTGGNHLEINGEAVAMDQTGRFERTIPLAAGNNEILMRARDAAGNTGTWKKEVFLDQLPPDLHDVSISTSYAGAGAPVTIRVTALDETGMKAAAPFVLMVGDHEYSGYLKKCPEKNCYQAAFTIPAGMQGRIRMKSVILEDYLGNRKQYAMR